VEYTAGATVVVEAEVEEELEEVDDVVELVWFTATVVVAEVVEFVAVEFVC